MVLFAALLRFICGLGCVYSLQNWKAHWIDEFNLTESEMGTMMATSSTLSACVLFLIGICVDKWGTRRMVLRVLLPGCVFTCLLSGKMTEKYQVWASLFLLRFFAQGGLGLVPAVIVSHWFFRQRGRALSFMGIGAFLSGAIMPVLNTKMIEEVGWRAAWYAWAIVIAVFIIPVTCCFFYSRPEDLGLEGEPAALVDRVN